MKVYLLAVMIIGNFILQSTILEHFRIAGILPNTALLIIVTVSILYGRKDGIIAGVLAGILQDIFFGKAIGINILIYASIGYIVGGLENKVFKDNYFTPFLFIVFSTIYYHSVYFIFMHFLKQSVSYFFVLRSIILIETIYNSIVGIIFYRVFYKRVY